MLGQINIQTNEEKTKQNKTGGHLLQDHKIYYTIKWSKQHGSHINQRDVEK
jgi:hypothetical protein